ncbi:MAG: cell envelope integrity protein TolA, partial [Acidithiobacillus sp.]|uniref:cell envelope integrity protein TolA n=1 Tax=Acidithiobacillus sp. TaxID=1872118 RepID=UPI003D039BC4
KAAAAKAAAEKAAAEKAAAERAAQLRKELAEQAAKAAEAARAKALRERMEAQAKLQAEANIAAARAAQAAENQKLIALFSQQVQRRVYSKWDTNFAAALSCVVQIRLSPTGAIIGSPQILRSSGNPQFDRAVVTAVEQAAPFVPPLGLSYNLYKEVDIKFNAEELNHG